MAGYRTQTMSESDFLDEDSYPSLVTEPSLAPCIDGGCMQPGLAAKRGGPVILTTLPASAVPLSYSAADELYRGGYDCSERSGSGCGGCGGGGGGCRPRPPPPSQPPPSSQAAFSFRVLITPLTKVTTPYSKHGELVEFMVRRRNQVVTLQWEPFEGALGQNGVAYLSANNSIPSPPPYPIKLPYVLSYNSEFRSSHLMLDAGAAVPLIFYLDGSESGSGTKMGDTISVPGGNISWVTNY